MPGPIQSRAVLADEENRTAAKSFFTSLTISFLALNHHARQCRYSHCVKRSRVPRCFARRHERRRLRRTTEAGMNRVKSGTMRQSAVTALVAALLAALAIAQTTNSVKLP